MRQEAQTSHLALVFDSNVFFFLNYRIRVWGVEIKIKFRYLLVAS